MSPVSARIDSMVPPSSTPTGPSRNGSPPGRVTSAMRRNLSPGLRRESSVRNPAEDSDPLTAPSMEPP